MKMGPAQKQAKSTNIEDGTDQASQAEQETL
jgi:hypothetical protein